MRLAIAAVFFCIAARVTADEPALKSFDERLDAYVKLRKNAAEGIPALKKNATPADIQAHEVALAASIKNWLRRTADCTLPSQSSPRSASRRNSATALSNARQGAPSVTARTPKYVR